MLLKVLLELSSLFEQKHSDANGVSLRSWRASIDARKLSIASAIASSSRHHHSRHMQCTP